MAESWEDSPLFDDKRAIATLSRQTIIPNPGMKSHFHRLARAGGLCLYSPTLQGAGFCSRIRRTPHPVNLLIGP